MQNRRFALLFACFALACGLALMAVTPIGQVADEPAHALRADSLAHGHLIGMKRPSEMYGDKVMEGAVQADPGLFTMALGALAPGQRPMTRAGLAGITHTTWEYRQRWYQVGQIAAYMPAFYVPAGVVLGVSRLLHVRPFDAASAARLVNLLLFVAMGAAAMAVARRGRAVLAWTLSVPMTMSLAGSFNQDGLLIAACVLAAALASRAWDHAAAPDEVVYQRWYWAAAGLIAVIAAAKPPYMALAVLLLLPLPDDWRSRNAVDALVQRLGVLALACLPALVWLFAVNPHAAGNLARPLYEAGPLWDGPRPALFPGTDLKAQLHVLLSHPWRLIWLPVHSVATNPNLWHEAIGVLGWLSVVLPGAVYAAWWWAAGLSIAADVLAPSNPAGRWTRHVAEAVLLLAAAAAAIWAVYISQYLAWTNVGDTTIIGPSGRYFLPVVPLLALALPPLRVSGTRLLAQGLGCVPLVMLVAMIYELPRILVVFFNMS